jgi:glycosyltransferase involved in cell wall biosynthesis
MSEKLVMVINDPDFFLSHRKEIAVAAKKTGYQVIIASIPDGQSEKKILDLGLEFQPLKFSRTGVNPLIEIWGLIHLWLLFWRFKPQLVHLVTIKPVLYGGLAARLAPVQSVVYAISGLGFIFSSQTLKAKILRPIISRLYAFSLGHKNSSIIFQNRDDRELLTTQANIADQKIEMIRGSGVDLNRFAHSPMPPTSPLIFVFAARLLLDKGIREFIEAARLLRTSYEAVEFWVIGAPDPKNPMSVQSTDLEEWKKEAKLVFWGHREDIPELFSRAHVVVLPSYREGLPKVLLEAQAAGRPVITTNAPGCRDAIELNVTGLLVPVNNARALALAMEGFIKHPQKMAEMGVAARALAERAFSVEGVVERHLEIYRKLQGRN